MAETIVRLEDLKDAVPKFRVAADDLNKVNSTVNAALNGLDGIIGSKAGYTSEVYEHLIIELADALDRAIADYEEALSVLVNNPNDPIWKTLPDDPNTDDGDVATPWPDGKPGKPPKPPKDKDKNKDDSSGPSYPGGQPSSSGQGNQNDGDGASGDDQQNGSQGQGQGQSGGNQGQGQGQSGGHPGSGGEGQGAAAGGVVGAVMGALGLNRKKTGDDEEEEEEEVKKPEYVSAINAPVKKELDEKTQLLQQTQARMTELEAARIDKADLLGRLQAAAAAGSDSGLEERIAQLKRELTEIDTELYYGKEDIPRLQEEIEALQKRLDIFQFGPDADMDLIASYEGGETSIWIRNATRNEDNSVNCVNYVVNRMPIPPELPFNAHLWDEQVEKYGPKYGITIGDVPLEGSVIVMEREHSYAHDIYGHVMYVERVDENGVVWVTDNNYMDKPVRLDDLTSETSGPYIKYLYFPWQTKV